MTKGLTRWGHPLDGSWPNPPRRSAIAEVKRLPGYRSGMSWVRQRRAALEDASCLRPFCSSSCFLIFVWCLRLFFLVVFLLIIFSSCFSLFGLELGQVL